MRQIKSANGIIINGNKILLCKRAKTEKLFAGYWCCPGGKQDFEDEDSQDIAVREVKEETGLKFVIERKFASYKKEYDDFVLESDFFIGKGEGDVYTEDDEVEDVGWFSYAEAIELPLAFSYREIIEELKREGLFD